MIKCSFFQVVENLPSPEKWVWNKQKNNFVSCWMTQLSVYEACKGLTKCKADRDVLDVAPI